MVVELNAHRIALVMKKEKFKYYKCWIAAAVIKCIIFFTIQKALIRVTGKNWNLEERGLEEPQQHDCSYSRGPQPR